MSLPLLGLCSMAKRSSLLSRFEIAAPCPASWDAMEGTDKVRYCGECRLNVYNLSAMSTNEAEKLILQKEGKLCARIYRRRDGTIITENCPVGLRWLRNKIRIASAFFACLISWVLAAARGEAQEFKLTMPDLHSGPTITLAGAGTVVPPSPETLRKNLPVSALTLWLDNGCMVSDQDSIQIVLRDKTQTLVSDAQAISKRQTKRLISAELRAATEVSRTLSKTQTKDASKANPDCTENTADLYILRKGH